MAAAKKRVPATKPSHNPYDWENNSDYPEKRGVCDFCGQRDDLKLAFDRIMWICKNASPCVLRWRKSRESKES